jgi:hypothetical protein
MSVLRNNKDFKGGWDNHRPIDDGAAQASARSIMVTRTLTTNGVFALALARLSFTRLLVEPDL